MNNKAFWFLENLDVKKMFCETGIKDVKDQVIHRKYAKGDFVYLPDDCSDRIFVIQEGRVKIGSSSENTKEVTKTILSKGEIFGELAVIGQEKRSEFAQAMDKTVICEVTLEQLKLLMKENKQVSIFFMKLMGDRMRQMEQRLESLVFKDSRTRIIEYLVEMLEKGGERVGYEYVIRDVITHQDIANITATSRQTVTTVLNELRSEGIISFNRRRILIRNLDRLKSETFN